MLKNVHKIVQLALCCSITRARSHAVQFGERLAHHSEHRLTVQPEDFCVALPRHLRHHMIGDVTPGWVANACRSSYGAK